MKSIATDSIITFYFLLFFKLSCKVTANSNEMQKIWSNHSLFRAKELFLHKI